MARAVVAYPGFLLLDEPAAGMTESETRIAGEIIFRLREQFELGIMLIEHDMSLVTNVCDRIHVLVKGATLTEGPTEHVKKNPAVVNAYLGEEV